MSIFSKTKNNIGLYIAPPYLTVAERTPSSLCYLGELFGVFNEAEEIAEKIKNEIQRFSTKNSRVFMSVPAIKVLKKSIHLSHELTMKDIALHIQLEGKKYFPEINEELCFDFSVKEPTSLAEKDEQDIQVFAVKEEEMIFRKKLAKQLKLDLVAVEPDHLSALRFLLFSINKQPEKSLCAYLTKSHDDRFRLIIFDDEIFYDQVLLSSDLKNQAFQALRNFRDKEPQRIIKKFFISYDQESQEAFNELAYLYGELQTIEYVDFQKCDSIVSSHWHFAAQAALGLALRGANDHD